ncbi:MAG: 2-dehydropantoate 2-reductase [Proteobacteria bacterium]|nr:2-dehydropantoate 2-reductase [Pseudomonadota bacterium]MBU1742243.1 2-dehydropantoate 2-reductase [Pseudomonadota bacterium]
MFNRNAKVAVIGAGAVGGVVAAFLAKSGWDVEVAAKHQDLVDRAAGPGFHVFGHKGEHQVRLAAVINIKDLTGPKDIVFLATKAPDAAAAAREAAGLLSDSGAIVSLQNGVCETELAEVLGESRVIGGVVAWGATRHGPGELEVTSPGEFVIGNLSGPLDERLQLVQEMLFAVQPTRITENIWGELYAKLIVNSCINSLGVIVGLPLGGLLAMRRVRTIFLALMREMMAVAQAAGITVEPGGGGKLDYYRFLDGHGGLSTFRRHLVIRLIGAKYRRIKSSSLQSLERGRPTEIDFLNGYVSRIGRQLGVPTPLNDLVVRLVKEIEAGRRRPDRQNLKDEELTRLLRAGA